MFISLTEGHGVVCGDLWTGVDPMVNPIITNYQTHSDLAFSAKNSISSKKGKFVHIT